MVAITFLSYTGLADGSTQMPNTPDQAILTTGAILAAIGAIIVMTVGLYLWHLRADVHPLDVPAGGATSTPLVYR